MRKITFAFGAALLTIFLLGAVPLLCSLHKEMKIKISDRKYEWITPEDKQWDTKHSFVLSANFTNYGDSGWVTVRGSLEILETSGGLFEKEERIHLNRKEEKTVVFQFVDVVDTEDQGSFQYGFTYDSEKPD